MSCSSSLAEVINVKEHHSSHTKFAAIDDLALEGLQEVEARVKNTLGVAQVQEQTADAREEGR